MKPVKTLLFTLGVFALLSGTMLIVPEEGIDMGFFTFHMPIAENLFLKGEKLTTDVTEILEHQFDIDSLELTESDNLLLEPEEIEVRKASYDSLVQSVLKIELSGEARESINGFFKKLHEDSLARIMHYGDSQIEGDRISSYLRNKLQVRFGGTGPGLRPALQPYDYVFSAIQENTGNWKRYPVYGKVDSLVQHDRYGVMGAFSRFAPLANDSIEANDSILYEGELKISSSKIAYRKAMVYKKIRIFSGNTSAPVHMQLIAKGDTILKDTLQPGIDYNVVSSMLPDSTSEISVSFSGYDSPDIYGIELADTSGITVDNIALRGSSGTIFTKTNFIHSTKMYNDLQPDLFILQFGGNVMPYIENREAVDRYGRWMTSQVRRIKASCPGAAVLIIGPSDMSTKKREHYVTYELLPDVVETLSLVAQNTGSGFWNMYQAMGGHNSMSAWVNAEPELARPDYVHFSARGARLIANMFYNALILEYNNYLKEKE